MPPLILASTSRHRRGLLTRAGFIFEVIAPGVDEDALKDDRPARDLALMLAQAKARAVATSRPDAIVIGSDQVCMLGDMRLDKGGSRSAAIEQLSAMAGRTHELVTAMAVMHNGAMQTHVEVAKLTMRQLAPDQIARYVDADEPIDCAGSYRLESRGVTLFSRIETHDHTAIVGLPMLALTEILSRFGVIVP